MDHTGRSIAEVSTECPPAPYRQGAQRLAHRPMPAGTHQRAPAGTTVARGGVVPCADRFSVLQILAQTARARAAVRVFAMGQPPFQPPNRARDIAVFRAAFGPAPEQRL